jgi:predicted RNA binding protein YcfA (HicA-like mRNA interferase family)
MTELSAVTAGRLLRALQRGGFFVHHVSDSHHVLKHPARPALRVVVPYHVGDIKRGTPRSILRQANLSVDELIALLR